MGLTLTARVVFLYGSVRGRAVGRRFWRHPWAFPLFGMIAYSTTFCTALCAFSHFSQCTKCAAIIGIMDECSKSRSRDSWNWPQLSSSCPTRILYGGELGLISRTLGIAFVLVVFFLTGMYLLGKLRFPHEEKVELVGVGRLFAAVAFFVLALYMIPGLFGAPLNALDAYLPPRQSTDIIFFGEGEAGQVSDPEEGWFVDDIEGAYAQATALGAARICRLFRLDVH